MRESMARLTPQFSADRAVREYTEQHYLPATAEFLIRSANKGEKGKQMVEGLHILNQNWGFVQFGEIRIQHKFDKQHNIEVQIYFNNLDPI